MLEESRTARQDDRAPVDAVASVRRNRRSEERQREKQDERGRPGIAPGTVRARCFGLLLSQQKYSEIRKGVLCHKEESAQGQHELKRAGNYHGEQRCRLAQSPTEGVPPHLRE
jgi:hypothetical protein